MGKIVKYCAACEEGFAEKFAFCPNCGGALTAYELNPVTEKAAASVKNSEPENLKAETFAPAAAIVPAATTEASFAETNPVETETAAFSSNGNKGDEKILDDEYLPEETASFNAPAASNGNGNGFHTDDFSSQHQYRTNLQTDDYSRNDSGGFHVTVIEEKNSGIRNALLLGAFVFVVTVTLAGVVASLFTKELYAAGVPNTDLMNAMLLDEIPTEVEEIEKKKDNDKGGGGGGGGKEDEDEVSKGTPPRQTDVQLNPPTSKVPQMENPELRYDMSTIGKRDIKRTEEPIGNPFGQSGKLSDGPGKGGGMGNGTGTGFGGGRGGGAGNGIGTGNGDGIGDGDGDDSGPGSGGNAPPPLKVKKPEPVGPTEPVKIISKPRANYTDAARTNNIQGVVRVRVTFLANGTIGSISPVSNLGYGLTEQALAAARSIRFEPAKKGGVPYSVTKVVEYTFTLY